MNKDAKSEHHYFVFFNILEEKSKARIHNKWVSTYFLQARKQLPISFSVKVNFARVNAILDANISRVADSEKLAQAIAMTV